MIRLRGATRRAQRLHVLQTAGQSCGVLVAAVAGGATLGRSNRALRIVHAARGATSGVGFQVSNAGLRHGLDCITPGCRQGGIVVERFDELSQLGDGFLRAGAGQFVDFADSIADVGFDLLDRDFLAPLGFFERIGLRA